MSPVRALYSGLVCLAQPLLRRKLARRGRLEPGYLEAVPERFGHYTQPAAQGLVWVHAVSLGETRAAAILVEALRSEWQSRGWPFRLLLTHGTATGRAEGRKLLQPGDLQVWQPWDTPGAVRRFLRQFRPRLGLLMETEVWPNLVAEARAAGVPVVLANARLSERSLASALRLRWLSQPAFQAFSAVWAQSLADAERLQALGAPVQAVLGNLKFDAQPDAAQWAQGRAWAQESLAAQGRRVLMLASSREGEEAALRDLLLASRSGPASVQWLVVPRHPQRFDEVAALFEAAGFSVQRRSQWGDGPPLPADVWIGDSLGEMSLYYGLAGVALLGGSFEPLGGQNLIEAATCGCPVMAGPHTFNFAEATRQSIEAGAAWRAQDLPDAVQRATALLQDLPALAAAQQAAQAFALAHRGAARNSARAAADLLA